jgi:hypothetical protein
MHYQSFICSFLLFSLTACTNNQTAKSSSQQPDSDTVTSSATVIDITQIGCQFLEVEAKNYQYQPKNADDCQKINSDTLASRKSKSGKYIFRVTNSNVPYPLGFYLRGKGVKQLSLPKISGGGLTKGVTKDYVVNLTSGDYIFSCPLNPTPDYPIVVN